MRQASLEVIAPTVDEAVERGVSELGVPREQVEVTVLDQGGADDGEAPRQARVRLTLRTTEGTSGDAELEMVHTVVEELLTRMGLHGRISMRWVEPERPDELRHAWVDVHGEHLGALTAQRGDGLAALQYITRLIVARELGHPLPVVVDAEGFRERREQQLRRMARRAALQVMENGKTVALEPMTAADRRIVHLELRGHDQVYTESVGTGAHRKVTIIPRTGAEAQPAAE